MDMTKSDKNKKTGKLRRFFTYGAGGIAALTTLFHLGGNALIPRLADDTANALKQTGVTQADLDRVAGGPVTVMRPDQTSALLFAWSTLQRQEIQIKSALHSPDVEAGYFSVFG